MNLNLLGKRFGRQVVVAPAQKTNSHRRWLCRCDCGNEHDVDHYSLLNGSSKSCGCYMLEVVKQVSVTHGMRRTREYKSWCSMKARCNNPNSDNYKFYGGRGIKVCDEWQNSFEQFLEDMGQRPANHSLDRIDPDKDYAPDNCRWLPIAKQPKNTRRTVFVEYEGKQWVASELARIKGVSVKGLRTSVKNGEGAEDALNRMLKRKRRRRDA